MTCVGSVQICIAPYFVKEEILAKKVKTICEEKISPIIENMGYEVVDIEYVKKSDGMNLIFYIDKEDGIQIQDCEKVSKTIDPILEELNPTDDASYILSVSSPGIDRPLIKDRDFKRNLNKEISITLFAKKDGQKRFDGELISYDENSVSIKIEDKIFSFNKNQIAHIVPVIKF